LEARTRSTTVGIPKHVLATAARASWGSGVEVAPAALQRGVDLTTIFNHPSSVVTAGHVARGQLVASTGTTGFSTDCHLHFETRQDGIPVNPRRWL